ncbi:hypothetical protein MsAg5_11810 [Methanosarcinaceae archaeon Ag5]|uniref:Ribonuclease P protein component 3 n=1 Tax=Methanolapillus africanus TaxID=3028297 RepID=A0AAE4MKH1_9EURY|nr:hypothetical protein [Methanosarcinaceae archaeon Ag5]
MADSAKSGTFDFVSAALFDESDESASFFSSGNMQAASNEPPLLSLFEKFRFSDIVVLKTADSDASVSSGFQSNHPSNLSDLSKLSSKLSFYSGVEMSPSSTGDLTSQMQKFRKKADFLSVRSADEKIIRAAVESNHIDLINPISISVRDNGYGRGSSYNTAIGQINHIVAKLAADNHLAFGFDLFPFLQTRGFRRSKLLAGVFEMIPILQKYDVPILVFSGAKSVYDLRDSYALVAFGKLLGLSEADAKKAVYDSPKTVIDERRKILSGLKLSNGVEIEELDINVGDKDKGEI